MNKNTSDSCYRSIISSCVAGVIIIALQEHLVGHPIYAPRGARKRLLALAELIRLQMRAEKEKVTAVEVRRGGGLAECTIFLSV